MHLHSFTVCGFRSLKDVREIPVSTPTILAGQNDGGKSAVLAALAFLVGDEQLSEDDRTYELGPSAEDDEAAPLARCATTWVEGLFKLDPWELETFGFPAEELRVRRRAAAEETPVLECWAPLADDERLRDPSQLTLAEVRALGKQLVPELESIKRLDIEPELRKYGMSNASTSGWVLAPKEMERRLPRLMPFDGKSADPDGAVRTALMGRYQAHMADTTLQGRLQSIENGIRERLQDDAQSLCAHIQSRCDDLTEVTVEPDVSFSHGLRGTPLRIARTKGEAVGLERSGLGSARRISLAIWEWNSQLLTHEEFGDVDPSSEPEAVEDAPPPVQTIVIYDEPDTHLDYGHQRKIMQLIRDQSALPHVKVIVATHSMNLIDGVDIADVVHLRLENGRTLVERLGAGTHDEIDGHLGRIAAAVGLRNSVLLHERCFLAVEGDTEQRVIPTLFRLSEGQSLQSAGIALWACFNNEGALHLAHYLVEHGRTVMLMVDADSRTLPKGLFKEARLQQFFGTAVDDVVRFVGEPDSFNELEELFRDELWAAAANEIWPKDEPWTAADFAAQRPGKKFSKEVLNMLRSGSPNGPSGKPDMMFGLVSTLTSPDQVPAQLREIFGVLRKLAAG
ncbi:ATP-dependent nuclease [Streptomyces sp. bgisy034]|uniref:ATP-dependent nuclease n=1 Tax=Streptomyces sp. bgisy034 TaxID=3413774 RepID=UPI003EC000C2